MASSLPSSTQYNSTFSQVMPTTIRAAARFREAVSTVETERLYKIGGVMLMTLGLVAIVQDEPILAAPLALPGLIMISGPKVRNIVTNALSNYLDGGFSPVQPQRSMLILEATPEEIELYNQSLPDELRGVLQQRSRQE